MNEHTHERMYSGLPFTNGEILDAIALVTPRGALGGFSRENDLPPEEPTRMSVGESIVLVLAAMSAENADRIVQFSPDLRPQVDRVRKDPERYIESKRQKVSEYLEGERPGGS